MNDRLFHGMLTMAILLGVGCGDDDESTDDDTMTTTVDTDSTTDSTTTDDIGDPNCGTIESPVPYDISDVSPAIGATVPNGVRHTFTLNNANEVPNFGGMGGLSLAFSASHTAGNPDADFSFMVMDQLPMVTFQWEPVQWPTAPGEVQISIEGGIYVAENGCVFSFPDPLFQYSVQ
ncbi:MAG: hypothetical protein AAGA56_22130 [Myxococcota bacterium]